MSDLNLKKGTSAKSAYNLRPNFSDIVERHTLAVMVENEPGVLAVSLRDVATISKALQLLRLITKVSCRASQSSPLARHK